MHALRRFLLACGLVVMASGPVNAELMTSDTLTVNIKSVNAGGDKPDTITLTGPEVVIDSKEQFEAKIAIDLSKAVGFVGKDGYILLCEPSMNAKGCGAKNAFKGVSDIVAKGKLTGANALAYFLFSDPFSNDTPNDAAAFLMSLYNVTDISKIPAPLGPADGILERGQAQQVGDLFGFPNKNAIIVTSDLDPQVPGPSSLILLAAGLAAAALFALKPGGAR